MVFGERSGCWPRSACLCPAAAGAAPLLLVPQRWPQQLGGAAARGPANLCLTAQLVLRWWESGHFPISNLYESLCFLAWGCTLTQLLVERSWPSPLVPAAATPIGLGCVAFASFALPETLQQASPLVPALRSSWLVMHVSVIMLSYAALLVGSLLSLAVLFVDRQSTLELRSSSIGSGGFRQAQLATPGAGNVTAEQQPVQDQRTAGQPQLSHHHRRLPVAFGGSGQRGCMGQRSLGKLVELGSQGNLGIDLLAGVCGLPAHTPDQRMAGQKACDCGVSRPGGDCRLLHRRQPARHRAAQLRLVF
jgi:hypothetical protein